MDANRSASHHSGLCVLFQRSHTCCFSLFTATFRTERTSVQLMVYFLKPILKMLYRPQLHLYRSNCISEMRHSNLWSLLNRIKACFSVVYHQLTICVWRICVIYFTRARRRRERGIVGIHHTKTWFNH